MTQNQTQKLEELFTTMSAEDIFWTASNFIIEVQNMEGFPEGTGLKEYDRAFKLQEMAIQKMELNQ